LGRERQVWGWDVTEGWIVMLEAIGGLDMKGGADRERIQRGGFGHDEYPAEGYSLWGRLFGK
jgi:hypothetical protein